MIISAALVAMLLAAPADSALAGRRAFLGCLESTMIEHLDLKTEAEAFDAALLPACQAKHDAWKEATVAADAADRISRKDSEEMFGEEVADYLANKQARFREYRESNSRPAKE